MEIFQEAAIFMGDHFTQPAKAWIIHWKTGRPTGVRKEVVYEASVNGSDIGHKQTSQKFLPMH